MANEQISKRKYTKDDLLNVILDNNKVMTESMMKVSSAIDAINDTNVLHSKTLLDNTAAIKEMVDANSSVVGILRWLVVALTIAIITLAGAEKVVKLLPVL